MKKPIFIIFNDVHLKTGNEKAVLVAFNYMLEKAKEIGVNTLLFAGDLFDSRSYQRLELLKTFDIMLEIANSQGFTTHLIPGNHDKTRYDSFDSFLDVYRHFPGVRLYKAMQDIDIEGISITMLPFFQDDMLIPMLEKSKGGDMLISHFEMQGSTHLGNTCKKTTINEKLLGKWKKVNLGHYHNAHDISKDIAHLPSFIQDNHGEDDNKGFSVIYDDLSYDIIKGKFKSFKKVIINLDKQGSQHIESLIEIHKNSEDTIRFEFIGEESKLKALDKSMFNDTGIDIKLKYAQNFNFDETDVEAPSVITKYTTDLVFRSFEDFCKEKGYNYNDGHKLLESFLKQ